MVCCALGLLTIAAAWLWTRAKAVLALAVAAFVLASFAIMHLPRAQAYPEADTTHAQALIRQSMCGMSLI